jgi:hypothetical protein
MREAARPKVEQRPEGRVAERLTEADEYDLRGPNGRRRPRMREAARPKVEQGPTGASPND